MCECVCACSTVSTFWRRVINWRWSNQWAYSCAVPGQNYLHGESKGDGVTANPWRLCKWCHWINHENRWIIKHINYSFSISGTRWAACTSLGGEPLAHPLSLKCEVASDGQLDSVKNVPLLFLNPEECQFPGSSHHKVTQGLLICLSCTSTSSSPC